jgi:hypothetical protein
MGDNEKKQLDQVFGEALMANFVLSALTQHLVTSGIVSREARSQLVDTIQLQCEKLLNGGLFPHDAVEWMLARLPSMLSSGSEPPLSG